MILKIILNGSNTGFKSTFGEIIWEHKIREVTDKMSAKLSHSDRIIRDLMFKVGCSVVNSEVQTRTPVSF